METANIFSICRNCFQTPWNTSQRRIYTQLTSCCFIYWLKGPFKTFIHTPGDTENDSTLGLRADICANTPQSKTKQQKPTLKPEAAWVQAFLQELFNLYWTAAMLPHSCGPRVTPAFGLAPKNSH